MGRKLSKFCVKITRRFHATTLVKLNKNKWETLLAELRCSTLDFSYHKQNDPAGQHRLELHELNGGMLHRATHKSKFAL